MSTKIKEIFALIDADGGGSITTAEVMVFVSSLKMDISEDEVDTMVNNRDDDGNGEIDEDEFCGLAEELVDKIGLPIEEMVGLFCTWCYEDLFARLKEDATEKTIRMTELRSLLESMSTNLSDEDLRKLFSEHDDDGSGTIDATEFVGIAKSLGNTLPISKIVHGFTKAREQSKARMAMLKGKFHDSAPVQPLTTPSIPPVAEAKPCQNCPILQAEIDRLKLELETERAEKEKMNETITVLEKKANAKPKTKRARSTTPAVCPKCAKHEEGSSLESQIWSLQTALEIRGREMEAWRAKLLQYSKEVDPLNHNLAERMRSGAVHITESFERETHALLGDTLQNVLKRKKSTAPRPPSQVVIREEVVREVEVGGRQIETLKAEKNKYKEIAVQWKAHSEVKQKEVASLREQLRKAQDAIVSSAGVGYEKDIQLQKTTRNLDIILKSVPASSPPCMRSISPFSSSPQTRSPSASPITAVHYQTAQQHLSQIQRNNSRSPSPCYAGPVPDLSTAPLGVRATIVSALRSPSAGPREAPPAYAGGFARR